MTMHIVCSSLPFPHPPNLFMEIFWCHIYYIDINFNIGGPDSIKMRGLLFEDDLILWNSINTYSYLQQYHI